MVPLIVIALLSGELSLFCDALQVVTVLMAIGAPVSHSAIPKLGSLVLSAGLDTCYAFNTISSVWTVLPAHIVWMHRKSRDMGLELRDPGVEDFYVAGIIAGLWTKLARAGDSNVASLEQVEHAWHSCQVVQLDPRLVALGSSIRQFKRS